MDSIQKDPSAQALVPLAAPEPMTGVMLDGDTSTLINARVDRIGPRPGFNPRVFRDPIEQQNLTNSIKGIGYVIESITLRPTRMVGLDYEIVAGHGRWLACKDLGIPTLPGVVRNLTDREALEVAMAENTHRAAMSPAEEALAARRMFDYYEGDRAKVLERLGWDERKLNARLLLLHATDEVLMALAERRIHLGHAEYLSPLEAGKQAKGLATILKHKLSVADVHKFIAEFALDLVTAVFDKRECQNCPHNTTRQATLFEANIGEGRCVKPECFHAKTREHVEELCIAARDQFNVVYIDTEKEPGSYHVLLARDVGQAQIDGGCHQCKHFGCLISTRPGEVGRFVEDLCFGPECRAQKMTDHQEGLRALAAPEGETPSIPSAPGSAKATAPAAAKKKKRPNAAAPPKRVEDFIHVVHRRAAGCAVLTNAKMGKVYAVLALLREVGQLHSAPADKDVLGEHGVTRPKRGETRVGLIALLFAVDASVLDQMITELAAQIACRVPNSNEAERLNYLNGSQRTLRVLETPLAEHFRIDAKYLELHTKRAIESILREAGFVAFYNRKRNDNNAFTKLLEERHADIVRKIMESGFDFKGFVPKEVHVSSE